MRRRYLIPLLCLLGLAAADGTTRYLRARQANAAAAAAALAPVQFNAEPFALAPFTATTLDGQVVSLDGMHGKVAVINFWATWCLPCRQEIPALIALQTRYRDRLVVLGIAQDTGETATIQAFAARLQINYPIVRTSWELDAVFSEPLALPTTYIVDQRGRVVAVHAGLFDAAVIERQVAALLTR